MESKDLKVESILTRNQWGFQFGHYRLEVGQGVSRGGLRVALAPKELGVLEVLVRCEGQVVSKEQIFDAVWPKEIVGDESLTRCIRVLRQRLDVAGESSVIGTVHRRGYHIAVPVRRVPRSFSPCGVMERSVHSQPTAYAAYLEGRSHSRQSSDQAIQFYEDALRIDARYAAALVGLAECRINQCIRGVISPLDALPAVREACEQAIAIDPQLGSAYAALGWLAGAVERKYADAIELLDRAVSLDPQYAPTYYYRAWVIRGVGDQQGAVSDLQLANSLDPYTSSYDLSLMTVHGMARNFVEEAAAGRRVLNSPMTSVFSRAVALATLCSLNTMLGNLREADENEKMALAIAPDQPSLLTLVAHSLALRGLKRQSQSLLDEIAGDKDRRVLGSLMPSVYVTLGQRQEALRWIKAAADQHCPWLLTLLHDVRVDPLDLKPRRFLVSPRHLR